MAHPISAVRTSMQPFNASPTREIEEDINEIRKALAEASTELRKRMEKAVEADHRYRLEKAKALLKSEGSSADKREAEVELIVNELRKEAKLAAGLERSALERLENLRTELRAVTSKAWVSRSEMELARG